jgi:hypothetical protein
MLPGPRSPAHPHRASLPRSAGKLISAEAPRAGGYVGVMSSDPQQGDSTPTLSDLEVVLGRDLAVTDYLTEGELFVIRTFVDLLLNGEPSTWGFQIRCSSPHCTARMARQNGALAVRAHLKQRTRG